MNYLLTILTFVETHFSYLLHIFYLYCHYEASYFQAKKINDDAGHEVKKENINRIKGKFQSKLNRPTRNVSDVEKQITLPSHQSVHQNLLNVINVIRRDILRLCVELKSIMRETIKRK